MQNSSANNVLEAANKPHGTKTLPKIKKDRKEFLNKFEIWRKAKVEKMAAAIESKKLQSDQFKAPGSASVMFKNKSVLPNESDSSQKPEEGAPMAQQSTSATISKHEISSFPVNDRKKPQERQSVFERLYRQASEKQSTSVTQKPDTKTAVAKSLKKPVQSMTKRAPSLRPRSVKAPVTEPNSNEVLNELKFESTEGSIQTVKEMQKELVAPTIIITSADTTCFAHEFRDDENWNAEDTTAAPVDTSLKEENTKTWADVSCAANESKEENALASADVCCTADECEEENIVTSADVCCTADECEEENIVASADVCCAANGCKEESTVAWADVSCTATESKEGATVVLADVSCAVTYIKEDVTVVSADVSCASNEIKSDKNEGEHENRTLNAVSKKAAGSLPKVQLRRSVSTLHRINVHKNSAIHRSRSAKNISQGDGEKGISQKPANCSPVAEKFEKRRRSRSVHFETPKVKSPVADDLRNALESWLTNHGHEAAGYTHLRCFGLQLNPQIVRTPLKNFESPNTSRYHTAPNTPMDDSDKENCTPPTAIRVDIKEVENWLADLYKLITELKYPHERCEEWLSAIRRKCVGCTQLSIYWECLAALEQSRGDMNAAIECYERAIIKGAEVDSVGDSLAALFDNLILEHQKPIKSKQDKNVDPKNIFKSTIIRFALQQKAVKEMGSELGSEVRQQLYVATPVRRSARIKTPYKSHVVNSLNSLDPNIRTQLEFKPNESLLSKE